MPNAIMIARRGGPEVLVDREVPTRAPGPMEVRISVRAAGVNFADLMGRMGLYPEAPPIPFCPGYEVAGVVDAVGEGVTNVAEGDRVVAVTWFGGCATEVVTLAVMTFRIPDDLPFATAAAIPVNFATADLALFAVGALSKGERVLIHGGAGGVGTAAVRLAKRAGAVVIASAGSPAKAAFLREEGVHAAIDYRAEDVPAAVRATTDGEGVHVVLDPRGGQGIRESLDLLCPLGRVVAFGVSELATGRKRNLLGVIAKVLRFPKISPLSLLKTCRGVHGLNLLPLYGREDLARRFEERLLPPIVSGEIAPVIHGTYPLTADGARRAHEALHARENIGKTVLVAS
ncbi:MAG: zinc-binding dehydrogenase [Planctomycetota bacterium]